MVLENTYLEKLNKNELFELAKFVVHENFKHHFKEISEDICSNNIWSVYKEEMSYASMSEIFVIKNQLNNILGSIRVLQWNYVDFLPIQKIFKIDPLKYANSIYFERIWHIGRFAIKKETQNLSLFKKLMVHAISPVCRNKGNLTFAECDSKLLRVMSLLGIKADIIGKPLNYLGSETIPICITYDGLIDFYETHKSYITNEIVDASDFDSRTSHSPFYNAIANNYTCV